MPKLYISKQTANAKIPEEIEEEVLSCATNRYKNKMR